MEAVQPNDIHSRSHTPDCVNYVQLQLCIVLSSELDDGIILSNLFSERIP